MEKKSPKKPACLTVVANEEVTPNMRRITLSGKALANYPNIDSAAYVKLFFDFAGNPLSVPPESMNEAQLRTYTVRSLDRQAQSISLDMALHGEGKQSGPASHWAKRASKGDKIIVGGPGSSKGLAEHYDWVLFAGDMTSLPAISVYLEKLPGSTQGYAVIQITSEEDKQVLVKPDGVEIKWVIGNAPSLADVVDGLNWLPGTPGIWAACEFSSMRALRSLFVKDRNIAHEQIYISSYWREGRSEDQHKADKRKDAEVFAAKLIQ
ncbi:siderophore-interacting protein [Aestuariibacter sp. A3R04]|uniref:siderophore-interacting protein n=1 Tax=Aestuariibacter sp. A3R04 TaxID=2841571 RepID=UPI001C095EC2|nr:siderophore-interacting protein [Aestuariibacter sp. A3R04]MBU3020584.1 siderophore-interacting protein [Aestuariibacter sp. A3R04]